VKLTIKMLLTTTLQQCVVGSLQNMAEFYKSTIKTPGD